MKMEQKLNIATELLAEKGMPYEESEHCIASKLAETMPKILIVDDEQSIRTIVKQVLSTFDVVEAENGQVALQLVEEAIPDLVIADINMPKMDGFTLLAHLRDKYPDLPVVGLSGYVKSEKAQNLGSMSLPEEPVMPPVFVLIPVWALASIGKI